MINLNNKKFKALSNSSNGEVGEETYFHYYQKKDIIWAEYQGGDIIKGTLVGKIIHDQLEFSYQHINHERKVMTGNCTSVPLVLENGKIQLEETWQWTCGDFSSGTSTLVEI
ncbi:MAG: hypothetical protein MK212_14970 [Saprospiraceae bacterium]|nr:hypothetical protein [Saprospiraceae bacterium]